MILVFLHGPPASGKYTVGCALRDLTGFELYHNHLVVDDVLQRHAFGTAGFVRERDLAWRRHLSAPAGDGQRQVIFTFNPENSVPQEFIDWLFFVLPRPGDRVVSVGLRLDEAAIESRLASPQRQAFRKLTDPELYRRLRAAGTFATPTIPRTDLMIDSERSAPAESARRIAGFVAAA